MPYIQSDGARLYYEEAGAGIPIVFAHEFSGDLWSWEKQIQHFSRHYRCIAFNARGYPPSEVPTSLSLRPPKSPIASPISGACLYLAVRGASTSGRPLPGRSDA